MIIKPSVPLLKMLDLVCSPLEKMRKVPPPRMFLTPSLTTTQHNFWTKIFFAHNFISKKVFFLLISKKFCLIKKKIEKFFDPKSFLNKIIFWPIIIFDKRWFFNQKWIWPKFFWGKIIIVNITLANMFCPKKFGDKIIFD